MHIRLTSTLALWTGLMLQSVTNAGVVIDFEELTQFTGTSGVADGQPGGQFYNGDSGIGNNSDGWSSQGVFFENSYAKTIFNNIEYESWTGWAYSNVKNSVTPGFFNQFAAFPEGAPGPRNNYAIGFTGSAVGTNGNTLTLPTATTLQSIDVANTTYALAWIKDGLDGFVPDPGADDDFQDGDFFRLTITGFSGVDGTGIETGSTEVTLADYGAPASGPGDDFRLEDWSTTDLSSFGVSRSLRFSLASSQLGTFGIDTPVYFAADNLRISAVPEPSTLTLLALTSGLLLRRSRKA